MLHWPHPKNTLFIVTGKYRWWWRNFSTFHKKSCAHVAAWSVQNILSYWKSWCGHWDYILYTLGGLEDPFCHTELGVSVCICKCTQRRYQLLTVPSVYPFYSLISQQLKSCKQENRDIQLYLHHIVLFTEFSLMLSMIFKSWEKVLLF